MRKYCISLFVNFITLLCVQNTQAANTLLVADIDDTLKVAHVLNKTDALKLAIKTNNLFLGMPELLTEIQEQIPDLALVYLSNAPASVMGKLHAKFIKDNEFPQGQLILRGSQSADTFKLVQLRALIKKHIPSQVIFFGDNGENDMHFYEKIRLENPTINFITFIRWSYFSVKNTKNEQGQKIYDSQIGFVTPLEIIYHLQLENILPGTSNMITALLSTKMLAADLSEGTGEQLMPLWQDCRDFMWTIPVTDDLSAKLKDKVSKRCSQMKVSSLQ